MKKPLIEISAMIFLSGMITGLMITAFPSFFHPFLLFLLFFVFVFLLWGWGYVLKRSLNKGCALLSTLFIVILFSTPFKYSIQFTADISSNQKGEISLYYAQQNQEFHEEQCIKHKVNSGEHQTVAFLIPLMPSASIRMDIDDVSELQIHSLTLEMFHNSLHTFQVEEFISVHHLDVKNGENNLYFHVSGDDPHFVCSSFLLLPYLIVYVIMACCIILPLSALVCVLINKLNAKYYSFFAYSIITAIAFLIVFMPLLQNMKISPSNLLYQIHPWNHTGIQSRGPLLSDPIDVLLPKLYHFKDLGFSYWASSNVFGFFTDPFVYIFNYGNWLKLLFSEYGITIITVLKHLIAFAGMYMFLKSCGRNRPSSFVGAVTFTFSSVMVMWGQWDHTTIVAIMPWLFYFTNVFMQTLKYRYLYMAGAILCLMHAANMTAYVAYAVYLLGAYVLFHLYKMANREHRKIIFCSFSLLMILSTIISAVFFGDIFEGVIKTDYISKRMENLSGMRLGIESLKLFLSPYAYSGTLHMNEVQVFSGLFSVIAMFFPVFIKIKRKENKDFYFWWCFSIILLLLIFTPLLDLPFRMLPILNSSRKYRVIVLLNFTLSMVASYAFSYLRSYSITEHSKLIFTFINTLLLVFFVYFIGLRTLSDRLNFIFLLILMLLLYMSLYGVQNQIMLRRCEHMMSLCIAISMAFFAKEYIPYIDSSKPIIPDEGQSETIQYLMDHSDENSRIGSLNTWNFPANTNVFYGLKNIRGHETVVTKESVHQYLTKLDPNSYVTETFTSLSEEANANLLNYASVKFVAREPLEPIMSSALMKANGNVYEKNLEVKNGEYRSLLLKMSASVGVKVQFIGDGVVLVEKEITEEDYVGNHYVYLEWDQPIFLHSQGNYRIRLTQLSNETKVDNSNFLKLSHGKLKILDDGIIEEYDANDRFFVTRSIKAFDHQEEMLSYMGEVYEKNTAFIQKEDMKLLTNIDLFEPMSEVEKITNIVDDGDNISFDLYLEKPAFIVVSDLFDEGWEAYANGKKLDIIKTNYLFKGFNVDQTGAIHIEMKYHSDCMNLLISISLIGLGMLSVLTIILKNRKNL